MNPLRLSAQNYRSFAELELELPLGCVAILGPNGAGKSSIVNAIELCLFGARSFADYVTEGIDAPMILELEFEHRGELYRVRRSYSPKGRGQTKLDFERYLEYPEHTGDDRGPGWEPLTRETAAATQALIEETLGLSRETFRASAFLAQGDGAAFTEAQPRERKAILAEVLGLGIWDELLERARADKALLGSQVMVHQAEIERCEYELQGRPAIEESKAELEVAVGRWERDKAQLESRRDHVLEALGKAERAAQAYAMAEQALRDKEGELATLRTRRDALAAKMRRGAQLGSERITLNAMAGAVDDLQAELEAALAVAEQRAEFDRVFTERNSLRGNANELNGRAHDLRRLANDLEKRGTGAPEARCERCDQVLGVEALAMSVASYRGEADSLDAQAKLLDEQADAIVLPGRPTEGRTKGEIQVDLDLARRSQHRLAAVEADLRAVEEAEREAEALSGEETALLGAVGRRRALLEELGAQGAAEERAKLECERVDIIRELRSVELSLASDRSSLGAALSDLNRLDALTDRVRGLTDQVRERQAALDVVLLAERAYGRDGIPALIVENAAIPQIETEADRILAELGTSFTVELRTQRALKSGEGLKESLDIVVAGPLGERAYETFSGGERTRLNLALRIALARLLAHRRGADVRMLAIDEPEFLDEAGVARLAEVLRQLSDDFERILLVSHVPGLREAFDQTIEVSKTNDRSRLAGVPEPEAVPA